MKKNNYIITFSFLFSFICLQLKSQDLIVKINGDTMRVKIMEVGTNAVSYKKNSMPDGPTFVDMKTEIAFIKYSNGEVQVFNKAGVKQTATAPNTTSTSGDTITKSNGSRQTTDEKNKIEMFNGGFTINGQAASRKDVNRYLAKSKNPAVLIALKTTKLTTTAQKITKITSIPTTIAGSITSLVTMVNAYQLVQRGRANTGAFVKMGLSLVGTLSLPITSKILKKKSDKLYDKVIDMYNVTN